MSGEILMAGGVAFWVLAAFEIRGGKILDRTSQETPIYREESPARFWLSIWFHVFLGAILMIPFLLF
jgi:hypothetical protein